MRALEITTRAACIVVPPLFAWAMSLRRRRDGGFQTSHRVRPMLATLTLGAVAFAAAAVLEGWMRGWTGIGADAPGGALLPLVYMFLFAAPLEQGLKVAAFAPLYRSGSGASPLGGVLLAGAAALGFVTAHNAYYLFALEPAGYGPVVRSLSAVPAHVFFGTLWGYALGKDPRRRLGGAGFNAAWLVAVVFNGVFDTIAFGRRLSALIATIPILACIAFVAWFAARDLLLAEDGPPPSRPSIARRFLPVLAPPSIQAMRAALRRSERPVMLRWIVGGAFVTTGVLVVSMIAAVSLGHGIGLDFSAVDRDDASANTAPLVLLGAASLAAFPVAGYLVAKASAVRSVLEPAIGAALAIAGVLVLLGLAAPLAVVFAVAFAPVAFALACAGAWIGMDR